VEKEMTYPGYNKFVVSDDQVSHGEASCSDNFMSDYAPVEKYLSDNAPLSAGRKLYASYLAENQCTTGVVFNLGFQSI
jgi:hypothetical protein